LRLKTKVYKVTNPSTFRLAKVKVRQRDPEAINNSVAKRPKVPTMSRINGINLIIFIFLFYQKIAKKAIF